MGLDQQARLTEWGTPTSRDHKDGSSDLSNTPVNGLLGRQVLVSDCSRPDPQPGSSGQSSSESDPTSRRRLNPKFVEHLQGLPEGWVSPAPISSEALATWSFRCRGHLRCLFSLVEPHKMK